jgi:hypothetical protein
MPSPAGLDDITGTIGPLLPHTSAPAQPTWRWECFDFLVFLCNSYTSLKVLQLFLHSPFTLKVSSTWCHHLQYYCTTRRRARLDLLSPNPLPTTSITAQQYSVELLLLRVMVGYV